MGWNIERTREGEAKLQQKETEKQRKVSESSQVTEDRVSLFIVFINKSMHLGHWVASSSLYRVSLIQPHKIWKMLFYQGNYRQVWIRLLKKIYSSYSVYLTSNYFNRQWLKQLQKITTTFGQRRRRRNLTVKVTLFSWKSLFGSILSKQSQVHRLIVCCHWKEEEVIHCWYRTTHWRQRRSTETERRPRSSLNFYRSMDMPLAGECTNYFFLVYSKK